MKLDLNSFLEALSFALDFVEIDYLGATTNHSKRVAYIAQRIAVYFNMSDEERVDLFACSLLHDIGLCEDASLTGTLTYTPTVKRSIFEQYQLHCEIGENNVKSFPFLTDISNVVKYHHENYDGSGFLGVSGDAIPLMAQIIALADTVDNLFHFEDKSLENRKKIINHILKHKTTHYSKKMVEAFISVSATESFWIDLQDPFINTVLKEVSLANIIDIDIESIYEISKVFSKIVDTKSNFTHKHTSDLIAKANIITKFYKFDPERKVKFLIATNLHDLGKLAVANNILDKVGELSEEELQIMKSHAYCTGATLQHIYGFEEIGKWAANHHEKLDGTGYPYGIKADQLSFEERLVACLDIYQALVEDRPYRGAMKHDAAMEILEREAKRGKIDANIVKDIGIVFQPKNTDDKYKEYT